MKIIEVVIEEVVTHIVNLQVPDDFAYENTDAQDKYILDNAEIPYDSDSQLDVIVWKEI